MTVCQTKLATDLCDVPVGCRSSISSGGWKVGEEAETQTESRIPAYFLKEAELETDQQLYPLGNTSLSLK